MHKVAGIRPAGGTNILEVLQAEIHNSTTEEDGDRVFILLSDGQDTTGCGRERLISRGNDINKNTQVVLFGVGNGHDSALFKGIVTRRASGQYKFVDNVENISIAISEVLFGLLNRLLKNVSITVQNGEIYCWSSNKWTTVIHVEDVVVGRKKTFNVRSSDPTHFKVTICADNFEHEITEFHFEMDLTYDKYRHRTMELLGESAAVEHESYTKVKELKGRLKNMMSELKAYMDENKLRDDKRYQVLCDDIFMCHQTMGTSHGTMYATGRQTSQGTQSIYNNVIPQRDLTGRLTKMVRGITGYVSHMNTQFELDEFDELPPVPRLTRGVSHFISQMEDANEGVSDSDLFAVLDNSPVDLLVRSSNNTMISGSRPYSALHEIENENEELDDIMSQHQMLDSDDSPNANLPELKFIREVSLGSQPTNTV